MTSLPQGRDAAREARAVYTGLTPGRPFPWGRDEGTFPAFCPRGHRRNPSTGTCWTVREVEPGLYAYEYGDGCGEETIA